MCEESPGRRRRRRRRAHLPYSQGTDSAPCCLQAAVTATQLQLTKKDLAASQLMCLGHKGQLNQQGQALAELSSRLKQLEAQVLEAQQQVSHGWLLAAH